MWLMLCEYATGHTDGTFSVVRGGLDQWTAKLPIAVSVYILAQVDAGELKSGEYPVSYRLLDPKGAEVAMGAARLSVQSETYPIRFVLPVPTSIVSVVGRYKVVVVLENVCTAEAKLDVREPSP